MSTFQGNLRHMGLIRVIRVCLTNPTFPGRDRGAQFYPSCIQIEVTGSGSAFPTSFVSFPGAYTPDTPGIVFDIYTS